MPYTDPETRRLYHRDYKRSNRFRYRRSQKIYDAAKHANQRAAKYGAPGRITIEDVERALMVGECFYCRRPFPMMRLTIDHAVPLDQRGPNRPANIVAACRPCNISKWRQDRPGRWSRAHDSCVGCGTSDRKHLAQGFCATCYQRGPGSRKARLERARVSAAGHRPS